jgi:hypothetical protein
VQQCAVNLPVCIGDEQRASDSLQGRPPRGEGMGLSSERQTAPTAAPETEQPEPELTLSMLPMECLLHVLSWCSLRDLMQCRAVERVLKVRAAPPTIHSPGSLQWLVQQESGMCPPLVGISRAPHPWSTPVYL